MRVHDLQDHRVSAGLGPQSPVVHPPTELCERAMVVFDHADVGHRGRYSVQRALALHEYCERTSPFRVFVVCFLAPAPALLGTVALDSIPLVDPSRGWKANYAFWIRTFWQLFFVSIGGALQMKPMLTPGTIATMGAVRLGRGGLAFRGCGLLATVTCAKLDPLNVELFKCCEETMLKVLEDAKMKPEDVTELVLLDGKELSESVSRDEVAVYGAAMQGAILDGIRSDVTNSLLAVDVTPLSLGIETKRATLCIYWGESACVESKNKLGEFNISGLERAKRGEPQVEVTFKIDANGILKVSACDKKTGANADTAISNNYGRLIQEGIDRMVAEADKFRQRQGAPPHQDPQRPGAVHLPRHRDGSREGRHQRQKRHPQHLRLVRGPRGGHAPRTRGQESISGWICSHFLSFTKALINGRRRPADARAAGRGAAGAATRAAAEGQRGAAQSERPRRRDLLGMVVAEEGRIGGEEEEEEEEEEEKEEEEVVGVEEQGAEGGGWKTRQQLEKEGLLHTPVERAVFAVQESYAASWPPNDVVDAFELMLDSRKADLFSVMEPGELRDMWLKKQLRQVRRAAAKQ
ncbi:hypothetical protein ON010_g15008 [Phytophthora cinnamomi]|nr:hypothetical protein ON010_g15008 [Phytophthora cinnamomi]